MSYLRKMHELRCQGGEEAVIKYERIQDYEEKIAECEQEIENCKQAIKILENGQDPSEIAKEQSNDEQLF